MAFGQFTLPRFWNPLSNRSLSGFDSAVSLNERILRVSDLCRVSIPTSAGLCPEGYALSSLQSATGGERIGAYGLKGIEPSIRFARLEVPIIPRADRRSEMTAAPITRSQRQKEKFSGNALSKSNQIRLGKSRGPAQRGLALFRFTFVRTKVNPRARGWVSPGRLGFGAG